ncbi:IS66 family insertion sequence element accessory protein TnpA [Xanthomonas campestris]
MQDKQREWSGHVQAWHGSGQRQAAYCRAHWLSLPASVTGGAAGR